MHHFVQFVCVLPESFLQLLVECLVRVLSQLYDLLNTFLHLLGSALQRPILVYNVDFNFEATSICFSVLGHGWRVDCASTVEVFDLRLQSFKRVSIIDVRLLIL